MAHWLIAGSDVFAAAVVPGVPPEELSLLLLELPQAARTNVIATSAMESFRVRVCIWLLFGVMRRGVSQTRTLEENRAVTKRRPGRRGADATTVECREPVAPDPRHRSRFPGFLGSAASPSSGDGGRRIRHSG